ncbi:MAG: SDR family NAD(P)-dependent oxidoreductase, partial [Acidobacteria bacterium]|nr:SDR family NAD(P)-dependent oxidoreductase [Acidobacteriota bacterium]
HPALLDAAWQTLAAAIPAELTADGKPVPWLPVALGAFRVFAILPTELWCRAELLERSAGGGRLLAKIEVFDGEGQPLAECRELAVQRLEPGGRTEREPEVGTYDLAWTEVAAPAAVSGAGVWAVLGDDVAGAMLLADALRARGARVALSAGLDPGERWRDPRRLARWLSEQPAELGGAVLFWRGHGPAEESTGVAAAVHLVQAMALADRRMPIHLVTRGAVFAGGAAAQVRETEIGAGEVASAALWGFGRTLAQESPDLWGGLVDLDPALPLERGAEALAQELLAAAADAEDQVALRGGRRLAARLRPVTAPAPVELRLRGDAAYLVTGGLGDLGLATARRLAAAGARYLVLMGRRSVEEVLAAAGSEPRRRALDELEGRGVTVECVALDVADGEALEAWYRGRPATAAPIRGVIHAAGAVELAAIGALDDQALSSVLGPKVLGALNLHHLFADEADLDHFVLYSSTSAVLGSPQLAVYAAANTFLDTLAAFRRGRGLPGLSLRWPAWKSIGMAARHGVEGTRGMAALDPEMGLELLGRCLAAGPELPAALFVQAADWPVWARTHPTAAASPALSELVTTIDGTPSAPGIPSGPAGGETAVETRPRPAGGSEEFLAGLVASVLELPLDGLDHQRPLNRLGLDSLMAVEVKNRVEEDLGVTLSVVQFLQGPSVAQLAAKIDEELGEAAVPQAVTVSPAPVPETSPQSIRVEVPLVPPAAQPVDAETAKGLLDRVDTLSDAEVEALLERMLAEQGAWS